MVPCPRGGVVSKRGMTMSGRSVTATPFLHLRHRDDTDKTATTRNTALWQEKGQGICHQNCWVKVKFCQPQKIPHHSSTRGDGNGGPTGSGDHRVTGEDRGEQSVKVLAKLRSTAQPQLLRCPHCKFLEGGIELRVLRSSLHPDCPTLSGEPVSNCRIDGRINEESPKHEFG